MNVKKNIKGVIRHSVNAQTAGVSLLITGFLFFLSSCHIYSFNDASIPKNIKTVKIGFIENKASYVNPQLAQKITDALQQKITSGTKLTRTNNDDADYVINGTITNYNGNQTVGISSQQANTNRLTISLHMILKKTLENKSEEFDISRNFDYSANLSFPSAEAQLLDEIVRTVTDEIFNHVFSNNW